MRNPHFVLFCTCFMVLSSFGQKEDLEKNRTITLFKNQISSNLPYFLVNSVELNYERILGRKFALGIGWASYGDGFNKLDVAGNGYAQRANFEINPFGRFYFNGNNKKSHFLEIFASLNENESSDIFVRNTTPEGYGVYEKGTIVTKDFGMGIGYGYRFLFAKDRLSLEGQIGLRTNFETYWFVVQSSLVRTGIRIGYRF